MNERLKDAQTRVVGFWNKYDKKQKRLIISIIAVVVLAVVILAVVLNTPQYETLIECENTVSAADVADTLTKNEITYITENDGLTIKVEEKDLVTATYLIAQGGYTAVGYSIEDYVDDGGFSTTSEDKERLYQKYLEDKMVTVLTSFDYVRSANVTFSIPTQTYSVLESELAQETYVAVQLTLKNTMPEGAAEAMARYCATAVGNDTTSRISIMDSNGNNLFKGDSASEVSAVTNASEKDKIYQIYYEQMVNNVTKLLTTTNLYSTVSVAPSLEISYDKVDVVETVTSNDNDVKLSDYTYDQQGGTYTGGVPGTDSNDNDTTYDLDTGDGSSTSISITKNEYSPSTTVTHREGEQGELDKTQSSLAVVVNRYRVYDEEALENAGELDGITWEQYQAENSEVVAMGADEFNVMINAIAYGTGIPVENIAMSGYIVPVFNDKISDNSFTTTILPIVLAVIILGLLAFVVWRSLRPIEVTETEPELSVEEILKATKEREDVDDIEYDEKSEVRKAIEKFVDENPESVALLLRNWLTRDWE